MSKTIFFFKMKDLNKEKTVKLDPGGGVRGGAEQTDECNEEWLFKLNFYSVLIKMKEKYLC